MAQVISISAMVLLKNVPLMVNALISAVKTLPSIPAS
jgi:hypothetical protein